MAPAETIIEPLVRSDTLVTLVGGGVVGSDDLKWALARAPLLVAADGAAETVLAAGYLPDAVIGDMDSVGPARRLIAPDRLFEIAEQDTTDFEKCLARITAPGVLAIGFLGKRLDHSLATLSTIARRRSRCLLIGPKDVAFAAPARVDLDLKAGTRVSLFPFAPVTGRSNGLRWPIDGLELSPTGRIGTSNEALGHVSLHAEGLIVLLPRAARDRAFKALFKEN